MDLQQTPKMYVLYGGMRKFKQVIVVLHNARYQFSVDKRPTDLPDLHLGSTCHCSDASVRALMHVCVLLMLYYL